MGAEADRSESLAERAYQQIRERILRGEFPLGAALSRRKLAVQLGMSFVPVSEALQRLQRDGLVESEPRAGTRVRMPSADDIRERYILREALESQAARLFAEQASPEAKAELITMGQRLDQLYTCLADADAEFVYSVHAYHMTFHMRIADSAGCKLLHDAIQRAQVLVFNWLFDASARQYNLPRDFHSQLASALTSGDIMRADAAMRHHVRYGLDRVLEGIRPKTAPPGWRLRRSPAKRVVKVGS
jgi:GntR family transcriptional regulator, rspAB operon transcriptional repressor